MLRRILCLTLLALATSLAPAQELSTERQRAFELVRANKAAEARPLLEKLAAADPNDMEVQTKLGFALLLLSRNAADPAALRIQARNCLLRAKQLGSQEALVDTLLSSLPADGSSKETRFSANPRVDQAMQEGETAFSAGSFETALSAYQKALDLDPKLYEAALFAGDCCFQLKRFPGTDDYYAKAVAINPNRETAYRYWGNALYHQSKLEAARSKYIEGIVCAPYSRLSWTGIKNLGNRNHPQFPDLDPRSVKGNQISINVTKQDDVGLLILTYGLARGGFQDVGRHSLAEETKALESVCQVAKEKNLKDPPAWLPTLMALQKAGLLEAYVLLGRPDKGIAEDYEAYFKAHRPLLVRYLNEYYR